MQRYRTPPKDAETETQRRVQLDDVRQQLQAAMALADLIESPDGTPADVRRGTVMALRGLVRVARYLAT